MERLRDIAAEELVNQQIQHNHFVFPEEHQVVKRRRIDFSDSDFEDIPRPAIKRKKSKQSRTPLADITQNSSNTEASCVPLAWKDLDVSLQSVLPNVEGITYVICELTSLSQEGFSGAPSHAFESTVRINLTTMEAAKNWLESMMKQSMCTYRHSKGRSPGLKRVLYKVEMHCQHQKKDLTVQQKEVAANARAKNGKKILMHDVRKKKTGCPSTLKLTVMVPTKKDQLKSLSSPYFVSHPTVLKIVFNHNHPITSAHSLSFRPIAPETKEAFFDLFRKGHSASSAYHWHETKLFLDSGEDQLLIADRSTNPTKADISRLYSEWQKKELGADNGKPLFDRISIEISSYNDSHSNSGGQAKFQCYKGPEASYEDSTTEDEIEDIELKKKKKKPKRERSQPMIIAVCTPIMTRVHQTIQQAGEMVFCDATSSLDRFNSSLFILSTSNAAGALPLGVIITSDEQEDTIQQGLQLLNKVVPEGAFYGRGSRQGPAIVMTDDSFAERNALHSVWPQTKLLLCVFHFLQRNWTWLHDGTNQITNEDRKTLIRRVKSLVYADNEEKLLHLYSEFVNSDLGKKYPKYLSYLDVHWSRRNEWAICYRHHLLVRGNHTNNYAEAGFRVLKDLIFNRVKAYNLVQMFSFVTECLELYYTRKLLSVAHNRMDRYISLKFQGINSAGISAEHISTLNEDLHSFLVDSQTERGVKYLVDMALGVCSCTAGQDGSPCSHQAAVVKHYHIPAVNTIPTLSSESRQLLANIALGSSAVQSSHFYSSLHQKHEEQVSLRSAQESNVDNPDFSGPEWDLIRGLASENDKECARTDGNLNVDKILAEVEEVFADIRVRMKDSSVVAQGMQTFIKRYKEMSSRGKFANAALASSLHRFGWVFGGTTRSTQGGFLRRGRRIPVNAKAAGRRRGGLSKGKGKTAPGRPKGAKLACYPATYNMTTRKPAKGKRLHSLSTNIAAGKQNAGKW